MPFSSLMKDKISIFDVQGDLVASDQAASVQGGKRVFTKTADYVVDVDYLIERRLPNGLVEKYRVIEPNFMAGLEDIPSHYQMTVTNVKSSSAKTNSVVNNITLSGQSSYYHNSSNNSTNVYNTYTLHQYEKALEAVNNEISELGLNQSDRDLIKSSLAAIENELKKPVPNKDVLSTCISFLPTSIGTLESVLNLGQMLGIS